MLRRPFTVFEDGIQKKAMQEAGFVDIIEKDLKVSLDADQPANPLIGCKANTTTESRWSVASRSDASGDWFVHAACP